MNNAKHLQFLTAKSVLYALCFVSAELGIAQGEELEKVKIGISSALTGNAASYGSDVKNALVFANEKLAGGRYELVIEDDQCIDREAVTIANKLVNIDKVKFVLGFGCSGALLAAAPVYERSKVVVIASGAGAPAITNSGDYIFRTKPSLTVAAELLAKDISANFDKVGILTEETVYSQGLTKSFSEFAAQKNLVVINENFAPQTSDFRSTLHRLKAQGVKSLFINTQAEPGLIVVYKQLLEMDWPVTIYGNFHPGSPVFLETFGKKADGILFTDLAFNNSYLNTQAQTLIGEFERKYGPPKSSEHFVSLSILAFAALDQAIRSGKDVKEYLYSSSFDELVSGGFSFDKNGDITSDKVTYVLKVIQNGIPVPRL